MPCTLDYTGLRLNSHPRPLFILYLFRPLPLDVSVYSRSTPMSLSAFNYPRISHKMLHGFYSHFLSHNFRLIHNTSVGSARPSTRKLLANYFDPCSVHVIL